jgi:hypothetical protein
MVTVYRKTAIKINIAAIRREHDAAANRFVHCEAVKTSSVSFLVLCLLEHVSWLSYTETTVSFFFPSNSRMRVMFNPPTYNWPQMPSISV